MRVYSAWSKRRVWLLLVIMFLLGAVVLTAFLEPTRTIRGLIFGEPFFRQRPLGYWREILRRHGNDGSIPQETDNRSPWPGGGRWPGRQSRP
jgi:hypothetical protein